MALPAIFTWVVSVPTGGAFSNARETFIEAWTHGGIRLTCSVAEARARGQETQRLFDDDPGQQDLEYYAHSHVARLLLTREGWVAGREYDCIGGMDRAGYVWTFRILPEDFDHGG